MTGQYISLADAITPAADRDQVGAYGEKLFKMAQELREHLRPMVYISDQTPFDRVAETLRQVKLSDHLSDLQIDCVRILTDSAKKASKTLGEI